MQLPNKDLKKLKDALPRGSQKKIATILNIKTRTVKAVLAGDFNNDSVIEEALKIAGAEKERIKLQQQKIHKTTTL